MSRANKYHGDNIIVNKDAILIILLQTNVLKIIYENKSNNFSKLCPMPNGSEFKSTSNCYYILPKLIAKSTWHSK